VKVTRACTEHILLVLIGSGLQTVDTENNVLLSNFKCYTKYVRAILHFYSLTTMHILLLREYTKFHDVMPEMRLEIEVNTLGCVIQFLKHSITCDLCFKSIDK